MSFLGLEGSSILITGASSGIGREIAVAAAREGARVAIAARDSRRLDETRAILDGADHIALEADLSDPDAITDVVLEAARRLDGLNGLVHAAGVQRTEPLRSVTPERLEDVFAVNVTAAVMLVKAFRMRAVHRPDSSVVLLGSVAGLVGQPAATAYSASKGALIAATRSLAVELARETIRVNCICPGFVSTPMTDAVRSTIGDAAFDRIVASHPLGLGNPEDVANAALFLLSPASRWMTGSTLTIDGGYTAQ
ncbi:NAD(P)-dependent dehydrogenase (short-subunit alcohol dehydrogenase family) [Microbacterium trichothecenolyticum]|uniref:SDR family NAD(P)-dependent oxidoreductase n=1 Tax=Microbacterium trichothecenolyticum TaxID=69370 RepID=UPI002864FE25|nr:SDR family oxidoreductase [Microbacterium trichothecenolyticum]MDR7185326.1 NAD(P)-dependent dehydrogenase (short-subunit alcohol dehydrogenase family) [Microbacterium trichothecenolyticum]